jgi:hypothetical protein
MNDDELRAAAEEVARALGLTAIARQCDMCGFQSNDYVFCPCHNDTRSNKTQMRTTVEAPLDLLTDAGAAKLVTALLVHNVEYRMAPRGGDYVVATLRKHLSREQLLAGEYPPREIEERGDTWPAALVLAAHAAQKAGWLEEKGNDAE